MIVEATDLNTIDLIALSIIGVSSLIGLIRGFAHDFFGTAALFLALFLTIWSEPYYAPLADEYLKDTPFLEALSGLSIFLLISAILTIMIDRVASAVQGSAISSLDRTMGLAFGIARGGFVVCSIYFIVGIITPKLPENMIEARFAPWYLQGAHIISEWIPEGTFGLKKQIPIANFNPKKIYKTIESLDEAVDDLSTLKPKSKQRKERQYERKTVW